MEEVGPKGGWNWPGQSGEGEGTEVTLSRETSRTKKESSCVGAGGNTECRWMGLD